MFSKLEKYLVLRYSFTESHNLSMWTSYLFHKCNRCHVIDTVVQLFMTVGLGSRLKSMSVSLVGGHHFVCLEILVLQQGCSSKEQIWALSLCMLGQVHMALCVFQLFFLPVFCWLCCILVPSFQLLWRQGDWMKISLCQSLFGCIYPSSLL